MPEELAQEKLAETNPDFDAPDFETPNFETPDFEKVVASVSAGVLETMFFEEAVESACNHAWIESALSVHVRFDGSHTGEFLMSVSPGAAQCIACGFLGIDPEELLEGQCGQVLLELTNILCGAVMSHLFPESSLNLDPPEAVPSGAVPPGSMHRCFQLPDGPVAVSIQLFQEPERA